MSNHLFTCIHESVVSAPASMYQEQVLSYKHLDEPLDEGRLSLNVFWQWSPSLYYL